MVFSRIVAIVSLKQGILLLMLTRQGSTKKRYNLNGEHIAFTDNSL